MSERHPDDEFEQRAERDRKAAAEARAKLNAEQAKRAADEKAKHDADAKHEADMKAKADADAKAKSEADAKATTDAATKSQADIAANRLAGSKGAQVVLDPDSDAAIAARGGAGATITENTIVRNEALIDMGLDPEAPSAHETDPKPTPSA
jgi:colicin import membrane protein